MAWLWGTGMRSQSGCIPHSESFNGSLGPSRRHRDCSTDLSVVYLGDISHRGSSGCSGEVVMSPPPSCAFFIPYTFVKFRCQIGGPSAAQRYLTWREMRAQRFGARVLGGVGI